MKNSQKLFWFLFMLVFPLAPSFANINSKASVDKHAVMQKVQGLQMPFIENQGQINDKTVRFYANTFAGTVFVTEKGEIVYSLMKSEIRSQKSEDRTQDIREKGARVQGVKGLREESKHLNPRSDIKAVALKESLECPKEVEIKGLSKSGTKVNYFVGAKETWRANVSTWHWVSIGEVYKGIELKLRAYGKNVEKLFTVYPGGSVSDIKLKLEGAKGLKINKEGELEVEAEPGTIKYTKPVAYQEIDGKREFVEVAYNINPLIPPSAKGGKGGFDSKLLTQDSELIYGFQVGEYDRTKPLIIDPLLASTFLGGSSDDYANAIAIDSSGNVFIAGWTSSPDYPTTAGVFDTTYNSDPRDIFVSKLSSDLTDLLSSTFLGGSSDDYADALAIDSSGNVFIAGWTSSPDYPTTAGVFDTTYNSGPKDIFVSKLSSDLTDLLSSTFIGGSGEEAARPLAIDSSGSVFIAGWTSSYDYPTTAGAYDTTFNADIGDIFVSRLNNDLTDLLSSTFIGGSSKENARALAIDSSGNIFITGWTSSPDYPTTSGAFDSTFNGDWDIFVSRLSSDLANLLASTFVGGSTYESAPALAVDSSDNVFITGWTSSYDYPTTAAAFDTTYNGGPGDVIVSRLDRDLTRLLSSTFIGGLGDEWGWSVATGSSDNVFVAGLTLSSNYPTTADAYDITYNGGVYDAFILKINSNLTGLISSTFIGGNSDESALAIAMDSSGDMFVAGWTSSPDYPTTTGAFDTAFHGPTDAFISKLDQDFFAVDADGDGYTSGVDCNDNDPLVNPGATEGPAGNPTCADGKDNDCDGFIDTPDPDCISALPPDLIVSYLSIPANTCAGTNIFIKDTTKNQGAGSANASTTKFYFSTNNILDYWDAPLGSRFVPSLAAGGYSKGTTSADIPDGIATGKYFIIAKADNSNIIAESNETNNKRPIVLYIGSDLIISSLTAPASAARGTTISVTDTTKNKGCGLAGASTTKFYLSTNTTLDAGDTPLGSRSMLLLGTNTVSTGTTSLFIPSGIATGIYYIIANADDSKVVVESNEMNNKKTKAITISP